LHRVARIAHPAAVTDSDLISTIFMQQGYDRAEDVWVSGAGSWIGTVEVGFNENILAADIVESQNFNCLADSLCSISGFNKSNL
jgi:hypothetical protein